MRNDQIICPMTDLQNELQEFKAAREKNIAKHIAPVYQLFSAEYLLDRQVICFKA